MLTCKVVFFVAILSILLVGCNRVVVEVDSKAGKVTVLDSNYVITQIRCAVDTPLNRDFIIESTSLKTAQSSTFYNSIAEGYRLEGDTVLWREKGLINMTIRATSIDDRGEACFIFWLDRSIPAVRTIKQEGRPFSTN